MKALLFPLLVFSTYAIAEPVIKASPGLAGVSYSRIESRNLTDDELKSIRMMATIDIVANNSDITTQPYKAVMAKSAHTVCFSTFLTTEGDYNFVLDVGGQQTTVSEHIVLPARQRTCVTKELYKQMTFPSRGKFAYSATSTGYTMSTGKRQASSNAYIFVN